MRRWCGSQRASVTPGSSMAALKEDMLAHGQSISLSEGELVYE